MKTSYIGAVKESELIKRCMPVHIGKKVQWLKTSLLTQNIKHRKLVLSVIFFSLFYTFRFVDLPLCQNF